MIQGNRIFNRLREHFPVSNQNFLDRTLEFIHHPNEDASIRFAFYLVVHLAISQGALGPKLYLTLMASDHPYIAEGASQSLRHLIDTQPQINEQFRRWFQKGRISRQSLGAAYELALQFTYHPTSQTVLDRETLQLAIWRDHHSPDEKVQLIALRSAIRLLMNSRDGADFLIPLVKSYLNHSNPILRIEALEGLIQPVTLSVFDRNLQKQVFALEADGRDVIYSARTNQYLYRGGDFEHLFENNLSSFLKHLSEVSAMRENSFIERYWAAHAFSRLASHQPERPLFAFFDELLDPDLRGLSLRKKAPLLVASFESLIERPQMVLVEKIARKLEASSAVAPSAEIHPTVLDLQNRIQQVKARLCGDLFLPED